MGRGGYSGSPQLGMIYALVIMTEFCFIRLSRADAQTRKHIMPLPRKTGLRAGAAPALLLGLAFIAPVAAQAGPPAYTLNLPAQERRVRR